jgi:hypothetical protein
MGDPGPQGPVGERGIPGPVGLVKIARAEWSESSFDGNELLIDLNSFEGRSVQVPLVEQKSLASYARFFADSNTYRITETGFYLISYGATASLWLPEIAWKQTELTKMPLSLYLHAIVRSNATEHEYGHEPFAITAASNGGLTYCTAKGSIVLNLLQGDEVGLYVWHELGEDPHIEGMHFKLCRNSSSGHSKASYRTAKNLNPAYLMIQKIES